MKEYLPHLLRVRFLIHGFTGVFFYQYIRERLNIRTTRSKLMWSYLPGLVCALLVLPYVLHSAAFKREWAFSEYHPIAYYLNYTIARGSLLFFCILAWIDIGDHKNRIAASDRNWLKFITVVCFASAVITSVITFIDLTFIDFVSYHWLHLSNTLVVCFIAVRAIREGNLLQNSEVISGSRYQSSNLDQQAANKILEELDCLMENDRLYLQNKLNLAEVASSLDTSPHYLSQSLNQYRSCNFNDYINKWRVNHVLAKLKLNEQKEKTLLGIAMESGFNSKSSFNLAFKKHMGKTPSYFMLEQANAAQR